MLTANPCFDGIDNALAKPLQGWITDQQRRLSNLQHNAGVVHDMLLLSRLPDVNADAIQAKVQKLDSIMSRLDSLVKLMPTDTTIKRLINQLTDAQTTIALSMGLALGSLGTLTWVRQRKKPTTPTHTSSPFTRTSPVKAT
jgi:Tfp pilus assembly protein PilO